MLQVPGIDEKPAPLSLGPVSGWVVGRGETVHSGNDYFITIEKMTIEIIDIFPLIAW